MIRNPSGHRIEFLRLLAMSEFIAKTELEEGSNVYYSSLLEFCERERMMIIKKYSRNTKTINGRKNFVLKRPQSKNRSR